MAQTPGSALQIGANAFRDVLACAPVLRALLLRFEYIFHTQVAQTAACNGRHVLAMLATPENVAPRFLPLLQSAPIATILRSGDRR